MSKPKLRRDNAFALTDAEIGLFSDEVTFTSQPVTNRYSRSQQRHRDQNLKLLANFACLPQGKLERNSRNL